MPEIKTKKIVKCLKFYFKLSVAEKVDKKYFFLYLIDLEDDLKVTN